MATIDATALPALRSPRVSELGWTTDSDRYNAYAKVLQAEAHAVQLLREAEALPRAKERDPAKKAAEGKIVAVRVAGYLFLEFETQSLRFGVEPSKALVKWFISSPKNLQANQHDVIIANGTTLRDNFIRVFRTSDVPYRLPSSHPSRASFDTLADMIRVSMAASDHNYSTSRKKVLARDGYRCVVTGVYNESSLNSCREFRSLGRVKATTLEMAHIFNESTTQNIDPTIDKDSECSKTYNKTYHAANAMAILRSFGFSKFADTFAASGGVHELWNLLSLEHNVHSFFDHLNMWFEHTDRPNRYKVCTAREHHEAMIDSLFEGHGRQVDGAPFFVEFNSEYEEAPPPDPLLLALHATCARVAHMSGAAEFFDQVERDTEETRVLAIDGSSGPLLDHLLSPFAVPISVA